MADLVYNVALIASMVAGGFGILCYLLGARSRDPSGKTLRKAKLLCLGLVVFFTLALALSVVVHAIFGHGPQSPEPMGVKTFIGIHPIYLWVFLLWLVNLLCLWRLSKVNPPPPGSS